MNERTNQKEKEEGLPLFQGDTITFGFNEILILR